MTEKKLVVGTRGSPLALWQAGWVKSMLEQQWPGLAVELKRIKTTGDKITDVPLAKVGGKALFVKEIEEALIQKEIDVAVHSMKDVPTILPPGLHLGAITKREDPRDALISRGNILLKDLPAKARIGTCSLRRQAQLLCYRSTFQIFPLRGNLDTRLRKLSDSGENGLDGIILAAAGLKRMGWEDKITQPLPADICLPAIGQGAVGIECRQEDVWINGLLGKIDDLESRQCVSGERALLKRLQGGCQVPIAAYGRIRQGHMIMDGLVSSLDGSRVIRHKVEGDPVDCERLGNALAQHLLDQGAGEILKEITGVE